MQQIIHNKARSTVFKELVHYLSNKNSSKCSETETIKSMAKNFDLTEKEFNDLRAQLLQGDESLFEQIFLSHFEDCRKFLCRKYKCDAEGAYDATMDTMLVFRKKIMNNKIDYSNLRYLFTKMAGQILIKSLDFKKKQDNSFIVQDHDEAIDTSQLEILQNSWTKLGEGCQELLKSYYYDDLPLKEIAEIKTNSYAAIRKQKERCISKLRSLFLQHSQSRVL